MRNHIFYLFVIFFLICFISDHRLFASDTCQKVNDFLTEAEKLTTFSIDNIDRYNISPDEIPDSDKGDLNRNIEQCWNVYGSNGKRCAKKLGQMFAEILIIEEKNNFKIQKLLKFMRMIMEKFESANFITSYKFVYKGFIDELSNNINSLTNIRISEKDIVSTNGKYWASPKTMFDNVKEKCNALLKHVEDSLNINNSIQKTDSQRNLSAEIDELWIIVRKLENELKKLQRR